MHVRKLFTVHHLEADLAYPKAFCTVGMSVMVGYISCEPDYNTCCADIPVSSVTHCQDPLLLGKSRKSEGVRDLPTGCKGSLMTPNEFQNMRREVRMI